MAIFTAIAGAISTAFFAGSAIATSVIAGGLALATSYALRALTGQPQQQGKQDAFGVQGKIAGGGDVPRSFGLGYHVTAGSLVYANTHGGDTETPNAFLTQVIALSDLPGERLVGLWVDGAKVTLSEGDADYTAVAGLGYAVPEYFKLLDGQSTPTPHLFIRYFDGTQTAADPYTVANCSTVERPYTSSHVGKGMCYAVIHAYVNEDLWNGFPTFKFELSGVPLYDPSKDSTVGGSGSHLYSNPSTWGGDGDDLPAVQVYNILRGFSYNGVWLYGLQNMTAARLPVANWIAQIAKCREPIEADDGFEPTYRTGGQIDISAQPANAIEALLTGCQGRLSEIGGFYKIHVGAPDTPTFTFSDGDILSTETQVYRPFFSLADSVNGIQATYADPAQGWNNATAPPYYRTDLEARDGNRRLMANPSFDFVPYTEQVQRLQKSAVEEGQRARTHTLTLPPKFWLVEPGDVGEWTSERNGYSAKQFRVDAAVDKANLDVTLSLTEVDPTDYSWDTGTDFTPVTTGGTISNPPAPQAIASFDAQPYTLVDESGIGRRPAILISWDSSQPGIAAVQFEVRLAADGSHVTRGRSDRVAAGNLIITTSILPDTTYQVRGQYIPTTPRDMLWSDYVTVTTPDIRYSLAEFDAALKAQVTTIQDQMQAQIAEAVNRIAAVASDVAARAPLDKRELRSQLAARSADALAQIDEVRTVAITSGAAFASFSTAATATWGSANAFVTESAAAIATLDEYAAASWGVAVGVDGVITGSIRIDGGASWSAVTIRADKFQLQLPGYNGDAPILPFTVGLIDGVSKIGMSGTLVHDGTFYGSRIVAGTVNTLQLSINSVGIDQVIAGAMSNTQVFATSAASGITGGSGSATVLNENVNIQSGKATIHLQADFDCAGATFTQSIAFKVDGTTVKTFTWRGYYDGVSTNILVNPFHVFWTVTGLSAGSHNFQIAFSGTGLSTGNLGAGQAYITDFRR